MQLLKLDSIKRVKRVFGEKKIAHKVAVNPFKLFIMEQTAVPHVSSPICVFLSHLQVSLLKSE